jgi:hypothetical protein
MFSSNIPYNIDLIAIGNLEDRRKLYTIKKEISEEQKKQNSFLFKKKLFELGIRDKIYFVSFPKTEPEITFEISNFDNRINQANYDTVIKDSGLTANSFSSDDLPFLHIAKTELVLKPITSLYMHDYIEKWKSDRILFSDNIIDIYIYGTVYDSKGNFLFNYIITKKYGISSDILKMDYVNTMLFYKDLLHFINKVIDSNYIIRNLMFINSGLNFRDSKPYFILLEYDENSIVTTNGTYFTKLNEYGSRCLGKECAGALIPYYVMNDYLTMNPQWLKRLNKLYSLGLAEITISLFYNQSLEIVDLYNFLTETSKLDSAMQYFHFVKKFNSMLNIKNIQEILKKSEIRFCNINPQLSKLFNAIIMHLIDTDYDKIFSPYDIKRLIEELENNNQEYKINYKSLDNFYNPLTQNSKTLTPDEKTSIVNGDYINDVLLYGGNDYYKVKYLKYKNKYLQLKKNNYL